MSLRLAMLPARQGDALWIEWGERPWRLLVDMGTQSVGKALRRRIAALPDATKLAEHGRVDPAVAPALFTERLDLAKARLAELLARASKTAA